MQNSVQHTLEMSIKNLIFSFYCLLPQLLNRCFKFPSNQQASRLFLLAFPM